jgi:YesN/AraC family two-component response regulator
MIRVCLLDDEIWALKLIENGFPFAKHGFEVVARERTVDRGLEMVRAYRPDVLFTDIRIAGKSGIDLVKQLRKDGLDTTVVIITGYTDFDVAKAAVSLQVFEFILKPIDLNEAEELLQRLKKHLSRKPAAHTAAGSAVTSTLYEQILHYVQQHYTEDISLSKLADLFHLSVSYMSESFSRGHGMSFNKYLNSLRNLRACELLSTTAIPIQDVAVCSGFQDYFHFSRQFKQTYGMTPTGYRKQAKGE